MKILTQKRIIDGYHFPLSEAIIFSLLLWCSWGLAESFYWEKIVSYLDPGSSSVSRLIYLEATAIYMAFGALLAFISYYGIKILLLSSHSYNPYKFRGLTLAFILASFFAVGCVYGYRKLILESGLSDRSRFLLLSGMVLFSAGFTVLLYRWASGVAFRIRRSGTMMLSIVALSAVLSIVRFPVFSGEKPTPSESRESDGKAYQKLMLYGVVEPLMAEEKEG